MALVVKTNDWAEVENQLEKREQEFLRKEGVVVPNGHVKGYSHTARTRVVDKQAWEVPARPTGSPKCSSANWSHSDVNFEIGEGIAYLTLNRPEANNALSETMVQGLHDACFELHTRRDLRLVVLRAEGKMFCAGGTPRSFTDAVSAPDVEARKQAVNFMKFLYYFQCLPQFTIGLAQGSAMGTGLGLLACCDMVAAVGSARFTASEVKLGQCPGTIAPFVARKLGPAFAKRVLCTGENLTAALAKQMGLITDIVDDELDFSKYVENLCEKLTLCAPNASARSKQLVQNVSHRPLSVKLLEYTGSELADIRIDEEAIKGMIAVQARTKPYWAEAPIKPLY